MTTNTKTLRDALAKRYPDGDSVRLVAHGAGLALARLNLSGAPQTIWFGVLQEAENAGLLDALMSYVHAEYPNEPAFGGPALATATPASPTGPAAPAAKAHALKVSGPVQVFVSYAHEDEELKNKLVMFLKPMLREKLIGVWTDRDIGAGDAWQGAIDENLEHAHVVLLLVSPAFLASDYCYDKEMGRALARHDAGEARVVPIFLRPSAWTTSPFARLQGLPRDAKPVTQWPDRDEALLDVERGLRRLIGALRA